MTKIDKGERGYFDTRNKVNDKTGSEWVFSTKSIIDKHYPFTHQHRLRNEHGGCKPPLLCKDIIEIFTKEGDTILDPFAGVGGSLIGATISERIAIGMEINPKWIEIYKEVCRLEDLEPQKIFLGNSLDSLGSIEDNSLDFILTDPPYFDMDKKKKTRGKFKKKDEDARIIPSTLNVFNDIHYETKEEWLDTMADILCLSANKLKENKYMAIFMSDMYVDGVYHDLPYDLSCAIINKAADMGIPLTRVSKLIWYDKSRRLKLFGYPTKFISSVVHTDILIFRKG